MLKQVFIIALAAIVFVSCKQDKQKTSSQNQKTAISYDGVYKGTLPCADCAGIEATLTLGQNNEATYVTAYLGKSDETFSHKGTYEVTDNILTLKTEKETFLFAVSEEKLTLLGQDGKSAEGQLAPYYDLKKMKKGFDYNGTYALFSNEAKDGYQQTLTITPEGEMYKVDFTASKVEGKENCSFTQTGFVKNDTLFVNVGNNDKEIWMTINPTHDQLGVEVSTKNFDERFALTQYCGGEGSLAGDYIKNQITAGSIGVFNDKNTITDVLHAVPLVQVKKKEGEGEFADDTYDDYKVCTRHLDPLFIVTPKNPGDENQKINRVMVLSSFFKTAKGIHCKSTFGEIKKAYEISRIEPTEEHIILVVDEIKANFSIAKKHLLKGWWNESNKTVNQDKIPVDTPIDEFILWWNE